MNTVARAARHLRRSLSSVPAVAVVLGSGFQAILESATILEEIPFARLPGFPQPSVAGHSRKIISAELGRTPVLLLGGRAHFYEGYSLDEVTLPIRVLAEIGVRTLLLTNAAGGINSRFRPGDFMFFTDHINLMGSNPLRGVRIDGKIPFIDLSAVYDATLNSILRKSARVAKVRLHSGIYLAVSGPSYETPAEIRAFARLGADAVGMSTVPEAIVARQCGIRVAALSCITNLAAGRSKKPLSHAEVLAVGRQSRSRSSALLKGFVELATSSDLNRGRTRMPTEHS